MRVSGQIDRLGVTDDTVLISGLQDEPSATRDAEEMRTMYSNSDATKPRGAGAKGEDKRNRMRPDLDGGARLMKLQAILLDAEMARIGRQ